MKWVMNSCTWLTKEGSPEKDIHGLKIRRNLNTIYGYKCNRTMK
jgi:hypothetical protein